MNLPSDGELIAYLDGELNGRKRAELEHLLESSWELRTRLAEMQRDVETFVRATSECPAEAFPPFDEVWTRVQAGARAHAAPFTSAARNRIVRWRFPGAVAAAAALAIATITWLGRPATVSAQELLARTSDMELRNARSVPNAVIYQKLRVRKKVSAPYAAQSAVWEIWRSASDGQFKQVIADTTGAESEVFSEFGRIYRANGLDFTRPLSSAAYKTWQVHSGARWQPVQRERTSDGSPALVLKAHRGAVATDGIVEASMIVREADFHPVGERLSVQAASGVVDFELAEDEFRIVAKASLPSAFFPTETAVPQRAAAGLELPVRQSAAVTEADFRLPAPPARELVSAAVEAHFTLHRLGLCQNESLEVNRTATAIEVRGWLPAKEQIAKIEGELSHVNLARVELSLRKPIAAPHSISAAAPIRRYIEGTRVNAITLGASAISLRGVVSSDARALRRLARTFGDEDFAGLPIASRWLLHQMYREHLLAANRNAAQLRMVLAPVFAHVRAPAVRAAAQPSDWRSQLVAFSDGLEAASAVVLDLFRESALSQDQIERAVADLVSALNDAQSNALALETAVAKRLIGVESIAAAEDK